MSISRILMQNLKLREQPAFTFAPAIDYQNLVLERTAQLLANMPSDLQAERNVRYGEDSQHIFDVFFSAQQTRNDAPVLIFWHGGGFTNGYKEYTSFIAPHVVRAGMVLVTPTYRLAPTHKLDEIYDDAVAALRYVHQHITRWGANPQRIYLAGHSAGSSLALMTALHQVRLRQANVPSEHIRACLGLSTLLDLHHSNPPAGSLEEQVYTRLLSERAQDAAMSPMHWMPWQTCNLLLLHGEHDSERVLRSHQRLACMLPDLQAYNACHSEIQVLIGADHFSAHTELYRIKHPWYQQLQQLLEATP